MCVTKSAAFGLFFVRAVVFGEVRREVKPFHDSLSLASRDVSKLSRREISSLPLACCSGTL
jgi:hypothetical protein